MPRHNGTRAAYELLEQWICCDCKEIYNTATVLRCLNCHHIFDRSHCEVEEHWFSLGFGRYQFLLDECTGMVWQEPLSDAVCPSDSAFDSGGAHSQTGNSRVLMLGLV
ncbi:uncharacterized protein THITE_2127216 [Thermothielavioides terrestris NRRL 8126]|uniref:Uncharacterized protein n=1 Tax=Thermothielavioides terrestris (strain ATCC 38088 / NRRL 8126) TaxID=578455 RepID=G2R291_THETT|nr:uncharacterized protein THITE_2127216 [Thermothielavioides terrestris NRRL 8126]AEO64959.1 hypothetical protein THITE_2127216 [Thermothielavioides terrestris NRRL 8126]